MKARVTVLVLMALLGADCWAEGDGRRIFSRLEYRLNKARSADFVSAIVILESPIDIRVLDARLHVKKATKARRHAEVLAALHYNADQTQPKVRSEFDKAIAGRGDERLHRVLDRGPVRDSGHQGLYLESAQSGRHQVCHREFSGEVD